MTANKNPLTLSQEATPSAIEAETKYWMARHRQAILYPATLFERAIVEMLQGWERYATAHQSAYSSEILEDGVLGDAWSQIGEGLLGLLNGHLDRLDGGTLDRKIRDLLEPPSGTDVNSSFERAPLAAGGFLSIYSYSRAQAIEDGVLIDVSDIAKEAGFRVPVALTQALWADIHAIPKRLQGAADPQGRLWDVLFIGFCSAAQQSDASLCRFQLQMRTGETQLYEVKVHCGSGDEGEPVLTFMRSGED